MAPEWEKAAKEMLTKTPYVPLAKVDATVETALAKKYDVQGFPTIKYWKDGEGPKDYDGPREHRGRAVSGKYRTLFEMYFAYYPKSFALRVYG